MQYIYVDALMRDVVVSHKHINMSTYIYTYTHTYYGLGWFTIKPTVARSLSYLDCLGIQRWRLLKNN